MDVLPHDHAAIRGQGFGWNRYVLAPAILLVRFRQCYECDSQHSCQKKKLATVQVGDKPAQDQPLLHIPLSRLPYQVHLEDFLLQRSHQVLQLIQKPPQGLEYMAEDFLNLFL